jgi:hypothetical protein
MNGGSAACGSAATRFLSEMILNLIDMDSLAFSLNFARP